ncbi:MAG: hypothetical protein QM754_14925 [Tepidisphaeraceae bacterium]
MFGQTCCRCRDDGAGRGEGHQFQQQSRPFDGTAPAAFVLALFQPVVPIADRFFEQRLLLVLVDHAGTAVFLVERAKHKGRAIAGLHGEFARHPTAAGIEFEIVRRGEFE